MSPHGNVHSQPSTFTADCVRHADQVLLRVSGRLVDPRQTTSSLDACPQLLTASDVRVELGAVTEIDARGLGMLAELTRRVRGAGGRLKVVSASPRVRRLLKLTHLDALLDDGAHPRAAA